MMDCKRALEKSNGNIQTAIDYLREQDIAKATQKASRVAKEGLIFSAIHSQDRLGVLLELNCETDFVARTDDFRQLAKDTTMWILDHLPTEINQIAESMKERLNQTIAKLGENITAKRFALFELDEKSNGVGVLLKLSCQTDDTIQNPEFKQLAKDVSMQIAATNPLVITRDRLKPEIIEKEKEIYRTQAKNEEKPEKIIERIVSGKLEKYFQEVCLLEQPFVKDQDRSVKERIDETQKKLGEEITVEKFVRFRLGDEVG